MSSEPKSTMTTPSERVTRLLTEWEDQQLEIRARHREQIEHLTTELTTVKQSQAEITRLLKGLILTVEANVSGDGVAEHLKELRTALEPVEEKKEVADSDSPADEPVNYEDLLGG